MMSKDLRKKISFIILRSVIQITAWPNVTESHFFVFGAPYLDKEAMFTNEIYTSNGYLLWLHTLLDVLAVAAVGLSDVLNLNTVKDRPINHGEVFWYFTPDFSFGFSPTSKINQNVADNENDDGDKCLCWCIDNKYAGGWRAGNTTNLHTNEQWRQVIFCER
ncbi:unnamed protein product [Didymodactylos carnosus]|uniref:Uncharacterized protein n=1 Tax=Didymodactylos carnosus TaxID=1234261 RepID=A0A815CTI0_9BILA|nr:unnamed protein product [Didymodactylos carnosus]CAF4091188.1 unnamed protein product [Didymodactylos carnosus]